MEKVNNPLSLGSAAHAAKRAADMVVVLQNNDQLECAATIEHLNEILKMYGEVDPKVTHADLDELKIVSKKLYAVFQPQNTAETATLLNALLGEYAHPPRLSAHGKTPWHLHVDSSDQASWAEWFAASSALALAVLLAEKRRNPGGLCASSTCCRLFIDLGKGGGRTYCSPRCATRERVSAYRQKK
jgi:hypothetical protein